MWRRHSPRWSECVTSALFFSSFRSSTFSCSWNRAALGSSGGVEASQDGLSSPHPAVSASGFAARLPAAAGRSWASGRWRPPPGAPADGRKGAVKPAPARQGLRPLT